MGTYNVIVTVKDSAPKAATFSASYSIMISNPPAPIIDAPPPPAGALNLPYQFTFTARNGLAPLTWGETGALPSGLVFGGNGTLSGTPTSTGSFPITVTVKDFLDHDATQDVTIHIYLHGFSATGSLATARYSHTATLLDSGKVLIAGGTNTLGHTNTAELYDPATGSFSSTGNMTMARVGHTATKLSDGKVLITGGPDTTNTGTAQATKTAELYDPATGLFVRTGDMNEARNAHTATLLKTGEVLIVGGNTADASETQLASGELYDPDTGTFTLTGSLMTGRSAHTATLLDDGRVLIVGGNGQGAGTSGELYDPNSGSFSPPTNEMTTTRAQHTGTLLRSGRVLLAGGGFDVGSAELFDPASATFTAAGEMATGRISHTATQLNDGTVLVAGGGHAVYPSSCQCTMAIGTSSAEIFADSSGPFSGTGSMTILRFLHTATLLNDGTVLVVGGVSTSAKAVASAELYR